MDVNDQRKLCYLTEDKVKKISKWIAENGYTLNHGYFNLCFRFSPYGNDILLSYFYGENRFNLEVEDDAVADDPLRIVDHIDIDTNYVQLGISTEMLDTYFKLSREVTEAHVNADCEPSDAGIIFEIYSDSCNVLTNRRHLLDAR